MAHKQKIGQSDLITMAHDYLKHLTVLDTGAIVLVATFLQGFREPKGIWSVIAALLFFLFSAVATMVFHLTFIALTGLQAGLEGEAELAEPYDRVFLYGFLSGVLCFVLGLAFVVVFAILNLW